MAGLRAYIQEIDYDYALVAWAESRGKAKSLLREGMEEHEHCWCGDFTTLRPKRAPEYDTQPVPEEGYALIGWDEVN
jgi:hypothetical protein